jgi:hypothetical protein
VLEDPLGVGDSLRPRKHPYRIRFILLATSILHVIDPRENAGLESLRILTVGNDLVSQSVGYTAFPGNASYR